jgi:hypothetical protein
MAIPGVGSIIQIGISLFDFSNLIKNQVYLIFSIGYCYGFGFDNGVIVLVLLQSVTKPPMIVSRKKNRNIRKMKPTM